MPGSPLGRSRLHDMCALWYGAHMDTTIRNLDADLYRAMKGRAALTGQTLGQVINEAMAAYLSNPSDEGVRPSLADLSFLPFAEPDADASERVDEIVYGAEPAEAMRPAEEGGSAESASA